MMGHSERLKRVYAMAGETESMGDIGCDHGYISHALLKSGLAERVVATDISRPSLDKAERLLSGSFPESRFRIRLGDGFAPIEPGEITAAIIMGMGGRLIADILERGKSQAQGLDYLIVQPMQGAEDLFDYLTERSYRLLDRDLVEERGKFYPILKVRYAEGRRISWQDFVGFSEFKGMAERERRRLKGVLSAVRESGREDLIQKAEADVKRWEDYLEQHRLSE